MVSLLVIADDFTGALDTGVQFTAQGIKTEVVADVKVDFAAYDADVLVIDAETRHLTPQEAFACVSNLIKQACAAGVKYVYKKTDSALRGNIGAELEAVLSASGQTRLAFFPAFPQLNRITQHGIHYIDGVEVNQSHFGKDPYEPVKHSSVASIIHEQSQVAVRNIGTSEALPLVGGDGDGAAPEILVFDALAKEDLVNQGLKVMEAHITLLAGCAGFAEFLPQLLKIQPTLDHQLPQLPAKFLVICGSVNPITVAQLNYAQKAGFSRVALKPEEKLNPNYFETQVGAQLLQSLASQVQQHELSIIESNDSGGLGNAPTADYAKAHGLSLDDVRERISATMGLIAKEMLERCMPLTMLLTGGDTLLQCLKCAGVNKLEPVFEIEKGVVIASFVYQDAKIYVITKSGGFGAEDLLVKLSSFLKKAA